MSQVSYMDSEERLEQIVARAKHIVVVTGEAPKQDLLREVKFPKETHWAKKEESVYREYVDVTEVTEVVKSDVVKPGTIKVLTVGAYGENDTRRYHEQNMTESPIVRAYKPERPAKAGSQRILFLDDYTYNADDKSQSNVFLLVATEGIKSLERVKILMNSKSPPESAIPTQRK
ncbi:hypothetical protein BH10BDE1_BH10BDE1_31070 [soil metagenome]